MYGGNLVLFIKANRPINLPAVRIPTLFDHHKSDWKQLILMNKPNDVRSCLKNRNIPMLLCNSNISFSTSTECNVYYSVYCLKKKTHTPTLCTLFVWHIRLLYQRDTLRLNTFVVVHLQQKQRAPLWIMWVNGSHIQTYSYEAALRFLFEKFHHANCTCDWNNIARLCFVQRTTSHTMEYSWKKVTRKRSIRISSFIFIIHN